MNRNQILRIYGTDYKQMTKLLLGEADLAGIIAKAQEAETASSENVPTGNNRKCRDNILDGSSGALYEGNHSEDIHAGFNSNRNDTRQKKYRIGIKPNLVCPTPAEFGATTHPEIVAGIIEYLRENSFCDIVIVEGSWVGDKTSEAFEYCGYRSLCEQYHVPFIDGQKEHYHTVDCAGMDLNIIDAVDSIQFLINVPVLKGHCQTKMTCALKNMKGLLPNVEKRRFHKLGLHKPIAHLSTVLRPGFIVVDHICGDLDFEEGGNPVVRNCIMAALDPVLTDSYACALLGYTADDVSYVRMAEELGCGSADLETGEIITLERADSVPKALRADSDNMMPEVLATDAGSMPEIPAADAGNKSKVPGAGSASTGQITSRSCKSCAFAAKDEEITSDKRILEVAYAVDEVDSCSACYGNLVPALYRLKEEGLLDQLHERIAIGQGHQGKTGSLGIGRCTARYDFCIMGCPPTQEQIYQELLKYITGKA